MRTNLFEFLYGIPAAEAEHPKLGERIVKMFEDADELEKVDMAASKKPLEAALKNLGVTTKIETFPQWCEIHFDNAEDYREAFLKIFTPDGLHDLAEAGWVPAKHGDEAQSNEPPAFKLGFFEIDVAGEEMSDTEKAPDLKKVMGDGREADTTEQDRDDDDLNPVENPDDEMGERQTGVSKASDGKDPEGTPKGSKKNESLRERAENPVLEGKHKPGCQCGFCKNKGRFGKKKDDAEPKEEPKIETLSAQQIADRLLEVTMASGIPPVSEPSLAAMRPPQETRIDKLRKRRPDLKKKGFFKK